MKNVLFENLLIADLKTNEAFFTSFQKGMNVVTSDENHCGKSSLVKSLYYTFGADVYFDKVWSESDKLYMVDFDVDDVKYKILRYNKKYIVIDECQNVILSSNKVSTKLAQCLKELFNFSIYLKNKKNEKFELAPPVFYFLPYYIDQDKGWAQLYSSFLKLEQYDKAKRMKSILFHLGVFSKEMDSLIIEHGETLDESISLKKKNEKLIHCLDVLSTECGFVLPASSTGELDNNLNVINSNTAKIVYDLGKKRVEIQKCQNIIERYKIQIEQIKKDAKIQHDQDSYPGSNFSESCPHCGSLLTNEIETIVKDNVVSIEKNILCSQIEKIKEDSEEHLDKLKKEYVLLMNLLKIEENFNENSFDVNDEYLYMKGLEKTLTKISEKTKINNNEIDKAISKVKSIDKKISEIPEKKRIEEKYQEILKQFMENLKIWNSSFVGKVKLLSPLNRQGSMQNKIILSQVLAMLQLKKNLNCNENWFPLVIDSPRGNEIDDKSGNEIIKELIDIDFVPQTIVATTDFNSLKIERDKVKNLIELKDKNHLLNTSFYSQHECIIESAKQMFAMIE